MSGIGNLRLECHEKSGLKIGSHRNQRRVQVKKSGSKKSTKSSQYWDVKTFTWYIPAPPKRAQGHREKEFDKVLHGILKSGHEVLEWKLQSVGDGGMYAVFLLASNKKNLLGPQLELHEQFGLADHNSNVDIELENDD